MARPKSLRVELVKQIFLITAIVLGAVAVLVWMQNRSRNFDVLDLRLQIWAERVSKDIEGTIEGARFSQAVKLAWPGTTTNSPAFLVFEQDRDLIYLSPGSAWLEEHIARAARRIPDQALETGESTGRFYLDLDDKDGVRWRGVCLSAHGRAFMGAVRVEDQTGSMINHRNLTFGLLGLALLVIVLGASILVRRALSPIDFLTAQIDRISNPAGLADRKPFEPGNCAELKPLYDSVEAMMARLERGFQQATRFTADASHELKTPIALLQAEVDVALKEAHPDSGEREILTSIAAEVSGLKRISDALLFLSKADAGQIDLQYEHFDFAAEIDELCEDAEYLCDEAGLTFRKFIGDQKIPVVADRVLFSRAVLNLVNNAVKYNRPNGLVEITVSQVNDEAWLEVGNSGKGIPASQREHIFDRFRRMDAARSPGVGGAGLGLSLVREICRAHGGSVELVNGVVNDVRFRIRIPVKSARHGGRSLV